MYGTITAALNVRRYNSLIPYCYLDHRVIQTYIVKFMKYA